MSDIDYDDEENEGGFQGPVEPSSEIERRILALLEKRSKAWILSLPADTRASAFVVMWAIYDFDELAEMQTYFLHQTPEGVKAALAEMEDDPEEAEQEAKWNPSMWPSQEETGNLLLGDDESEEEQELLEALEAEYQSRFEGEEDEEWQFVTGQFWGLVAHWVRGFRQSAWFRDTLPACQGVLVGNSAGGGYQATVHANPDGFPDGEEWNSGLGW